MKVPKNIRVGGINIDIKIKPDLDVSGSYFPSQALIEINKDLNKTMQYTTFIHEVLEAMNYIYDINLKHHQILQLEAALMDIGVKVNGSTKKS